MGGTLVGVVWFALYSVDMPSRHLCAQPFKLQLLLSAEGNQKQTPCYGPPLLPHTSLGDIHWFPVQSIMLVRVEGWGQKVIYQSLMLV